MSFLLFLLSPFSSWLEQQFFLKNATKNSKPLSLHKITSPEYWTSICFLLDEQPDKAVDSLIKILEVDSATLEVHFALGALFRRRGEVDRAIRIHQNIIARPSLSPEQRAQALLALGQDYLYAGLLDRAERIFNELSQSTIHQITALEALKDIYQREKAWDKAIANGLKLQQHNIQGIELAISHYYCEIAEQYSDEQEGKVALLLKALSIDTKNIRASLLLGDFYIKKANYTKAIQYLAAVKSQNSDFLSEALIPLSQCYEALNKRPEWIRYLRGCLKEYARISVVLILAKYVQQEYGIPAAIELITDYLGRHPSLRGLEQLIKLQMAQQKYIDSSNLPILLEITERMLMNKPIYHCRNCGFFSKILHWLCPSCKNWNSIKPIHGLEGD